jgi:hypothetical protein
MVYRPTDTIFNEGFAERHTSHLTNKILELLGNHMLSSARRRLLDRGLQTQPHFRTIVDTYHEGFLCACRAQGLEEVIDRLSTFRIDHQGFAYEGAAMALGLLDYLSLRRRDRFVDLLAMAPQQTYLLHVGIGWALARTGRVEGSRFWSLDPLLRWLAIDGAGFHDGFMRAAPSASPYWRWALLSPRAPSNCQSHKDRETRPPT